MKRTSVSKLIKNGELVFTQQDSFSYVLDSAELENVSSLVLKKGARINLLLLDDAATKLKIVLKENSSLDFKSLNTFEIKNSEKTFDLRANTELKLSFADFSAGKGVEKVTVNLLGRNAKCNWFLSSISTQKDNKEFKVSINHIAPDTTATVDSYGVAKDESRLVFSGVSHIQANAQKSKTKQNARIMVFSRDAIAVAKPILKIDENDVQAGHAAALGQVNEEHLFYLRSRGLSENEAKTLIIMGYLKPILRNFEDEEIKQRIEKLILERV